MQSAGLSCWELVLEASRCGEGAGGSDFFGLVCCQGLRTTRPLCVSTSGRNLYTPENYHAMIHWGGYTSISGTAYRIGY